MINLVIRKLISVIFKESSETIREATFDFSAFYQLDGRRNIRFAFLCWFVGYSEGQKCFIVENDSDYQIFRLVEKDPKIVFYIKKILGFGKVKKIVLDGEKRYIYTVSDLKSIIKLIYIFNGNLQLKPSVKEFSKWFRNTDGIPVKRKNLCKATAKKISLKNAWLSGFINSKGRFVALLEYHRNISLPYSLILKLKIEKVADRDALVNIYITLVSRAARINMSTYEIVGAFSFLVQYLRRYSLIGKKNEIFKRWVRLYYYRSILNLNLLAKDPKAFSKLKRVIDSVNSDKSVDFYGV